MNKVKIGLFLGSVFALLLSVLLNSSFGAENQITTTNPKVIAPSVATIPMKITGIKPAQASLVSNPNGTATVDFIITGQGRGDCQGHIMIGGGTFYWQMTASDSFPKKVPVTFSTPGTYSGQANAVQGCSSDIFYPTVTIKEHPDYPCAKYPGYKKSTFGVMTVCHIDVPIVTPNPKDFQCPAGTKFLNFGGYMFGCMVPSFMCGQ
jgi:hypothetical protein